MIGYDSIEDIPEELYIETLLAGDTDDDLEEFEDDEEEHDIVKGMIRTEKGANLMPLNKYLFWVAKSSNKIEIKKAVEDIYKIKVDGVNTVTMRGKAKRVRYAMGKTPDWKKAIVTLKEGNKIDVT